VNQVTYLCICIYVLSYVVHSTIIYIQKLNSGKKIDLFPFEISKWYIVCHFPLYNIYLFNHSTLMLRKRVRKKKKLLSAIERDDFTRAVYKNIVDDKVLAYIFDISIS